MKQSSYKSDLFQGIEDIKKHATRINDEASQCLARAVVEQRDTLSVTHSETIKYLKSIESLLQNSPRLRSSVPGKP